MRAGVYKGNSLIQTEEIPTPNPGPNQIVVRVKYSAICGSDVHGWQYDVVAPGHVLGHEFYGEVHSIGSNVSKWKVGDRVTGGGEPPPALDTNLVRGPRFNYRTQGMTRVEIRAYAEYMLMEEWAALKIPNEVSDEEASLAEPISVAVHAVRKSNLKLGDTVLIIGAGPIGLFCIQTAKAAGASNVIVSELNDSRRTAAKAVGADHLINPGSENLDNRLMELTGGKGADIVFECAAAKPTIDQALDSATRNGQVILVAIPWAPVSIMPVNWQAREIELITVFGAKPIDWRIGLELVRTGKINVSPLINESSFIQLDNLQEAFKTLSDPSSTDQIQMIVKL